MKRSRVAPADLGELLADLLARVDAGELEVSTTARARIEGALVACEVLAGGSAESVVDRLTAGR